MKKNFYFAVALLFSALTLNSCGAPGTTGQTTQTAKSSTSSSAAGGALGALLGNILGLNGKLTQADLIGTWTYEAPKCMFESENFLKKAGGEVAAAKVEKKLAEQFTKVGIKPGISKYTFAEDGSYQMTIGSRTISGTYTFDAETQKITMRGTLGFLSSSAWVEKSGNKLSVLYDADKLLAIVSGLGAMSNNSAISGLSSLLGSYDGMKIGFKLSK